MYRINYSWYSHKTGLWTESKDVFFSDLDCVKDWLDYHCYDVHSGSFVRRPLGGKIVFSNGDEYAFTIWYNGRFCKKYSNGVER